MEVRMSHGRQMDIQVNKNIDNSAQAVSGKNLVNVKGYNKVSEKTEIKEKDLANAVDKLNKFLEDNKTHAEYEVHEKLNDIMIKIVDDKTGDVIKEIPPKKILDMVAKMCEMVGALFDKKA